MVKQIKKILFASDLTEGSISVFEQTVALASQLNASITIVHVIQDKSTSSQNRIIHLVDKDLYEKNRKEGQENVRNVLIGKQRLVPIIQNALRELCDSNENTCGTDTPVTIDGIEVHYGKAAEVIVQIVEEQGCDMLAMGHYKKGSLLRAITGGNVSKNVIHDSNVPVFLVPVED